jgi:hypothetical protein
MTAAQSDERGDQGLPRTVDKQKIENGLRVPIQHGILNGVRGTVGFFSVYNNAVKREVMIAISRMVLVHGNGRQTKKKYSATADSRSITI